MNKYNLDDLEKLVIDNHLVRCRVCGGNMAYSDSGRYICAHCQHVELDGYGKVKKFLEENGPAPLIVISRATGIDQDAIEGFLKKGRIELPENSDYYLKCEKCGCSIRYGRMCPECAKALTNSITAVFNEDVGERPKFEPVSGLSGKMHSRRRRLKL